VKNPTGITLWQSLSDKAEAMARDAFQGIETLEDWTQTRAARHKEFMRSLGLDPLPERCDLKAVDHGGFEGDGYRARKIAFQILPDCWGSACMYYPAPLPEGTLPAVLYVCGHGSIGTYHYQDHPMMWARKGYACLIVDTIEQNDNPGEHHGSLMGRNDSWLSMGYTPAGIEVWNGMRALDILSADPSVDPERIGLTGVSGGGACSFHLAIADERVKALSTLCGISSPLDAITNLHLMGHCDCMYPLNIYGRDISEYAALIAPRPALFCFADHDTLFHPKETTALVERASHVYKLYEKDDHCSLVTCPGPHGDHPEFDEATASWFDKYVAGDSRPSIRRGDREQPESVISIFKGQPPSPNHLHSIPQLISPRGTVALPAKPDEWPDIQNAALQNLRNEILRAQPKPDIESSMALDGDWHWTPTPDPIIFRAHRGHIGGIDVCLHMVTPPNADQKLVLSIGGEGENSMDAMNRATSSLDPKTTAYAGFAPRVGGMNSVAPRDISGPSGSKLPSMRSWLLRAMALTGVTPVMMTIDDIGFAVDYLLGLPEVKGREIFLCGKGDSGVAALYYALLDDRISGVAVEDVPSSHIDGSPILGVLRALDIPQAVGLMAPRKVAMVTPGHSFWTWPTCAYERLGCQDKFLMTGDLRSALDMLLE
jgi:cephalosporin-C deacetylase-like acetyl esterase